MKMHVFLLTLTLPHSHFTLTLLDERSCCWFHARSGVSHYENALHFAFTQCHSLILITLCSSFCTNAAAVGFMPGLVFPFVKMHGVGSMSGQSEVCFEMLATVLMNWTRGGCCFVCLFFVCYEASLKRQEGVTSK